MRLLRWVVGALAIILLASCKIVQIIPKEGGTVKIADVNAVCPVRGATCIVDVVDFYFDLTFVAVPDDGYKFSHWKKGNRRFCGGTKKPCRLTTTTFTGDWIPVIQPFLDDPNEKFYLQPVFVKTGTSASSCSVYAPGTPFCAEGDYPTCPASRTQLTRQLTLGMTYSQVIDIVGCHGVIGSIGGDASLRVAVYVWAQSDRSFIDFNATFRSENNGVPVLHAF